jgi:hypothetical protein
MDELWTDVDGANGRVRVYNKALVDRVDGFSFLILEKYRKRRKERRKKKK